MTKQEAKELSLEVWRYLAEHPEIPRKERLPKEIFNKVRLCQHYCPLCDLFKGWYCSAECPLTCYKRDSYYDIWFYAGYDNDKRKEAAQKIADAIQAWEPEALNEKTQN